MKRFCIILIMCFFITALSKNAEAQIVKGEAFLGLNFSQIDGDQAYGYKRLGFHGGLGAMVPIYKQGNFDIEFSLEVALNQRGSHQRQQYKDNGDGITGEYDVYMNYLEVPVLFYFSDKQIASLGVGASYGRLVGLKEYEHGNLTDVNLSYTGEDKYSLNDFCFLADAKVRLHERLKFGIRFQYSLQSIRTRQFYLVNGELGDLRDQYNNSITARLIYVFNEDRSNYIYDEYEFHGDNPKIHQKTIDKKLKKLRKQQEREARKNK